MSQSVPDFTTVIVVISFLLILGIVALIVKKKSGHLKKIIKKENSLEVINQTPLNNGFLAYVFKVDEEKFFFVGHKSGRGSLLQIDQTKFEIGSSNYKAQEQLSSKNIPIQEKPKVSKPLQHVNISDLLTAHKKGNKNA
jgi:flagellar biogenesis protein FliO